MKRFAAVIVNYNCAPLAIDAALSVLGAGRGARAIIVDNGSTDNSAACLSKFVEARPPHAPRRPAAEPAVAFADPKLLSASVVGSGAAPPHDDVTIVLTATNRGFAAGCNIGLKALDLAAHEIILLLNPDALVAAGALEAFARRLADPAIGLCGASVLAFEAPYAAQALGGARLNPWSLQGENLGAGLSLADAPSTEEIERRLDYPLGAAIAFRPDYIAEAGHLDERYFLYFEEADWAFAGRELKVGWAREAVVYHRYGAATKSVRNAAATTRSVLSEYHMSRSRLLFARKWRPAIVPVVIGLSYAQAARRLLRGRAGQARAVALGSLPGAARSFPAE